MVFSISICDQFGNSINFKISFSRDQEEDLRNCLAINEFHLWRTAWFCFKEFLTINFSFILVTDFDFEFSSLLIGVLFLNLVPC